MNNALLIFYVCILFSCGQQLSSEYEVEYLSDENVQIISLAIDETINLIIDHPQLMDDSNILYLNKYSNELVFHEFKDGGEIQKKLELPLNGPDALGKISQFLYHNTDSIFLIDSYQYKVSIMDEHQSLKNQFKLFDESKSAQSILPNPSQFYAPPIFLNKHLYIAGFYDGNLNRPEYYQKAKSMIIYNLENHHTTLEMPYPSIYRENIFPAFYSFYSRTYNPKEQKIIVSFLADHHLQIFDPIQNTQTEERLAASKLVGEIEGVKKIEANDLLNNQLALNMPKYHMVFYDQFRQQYYRLFSTFDSEEKEINGLLVLDKDMKKLKEYIFNPKLNYNPFNIVINSSGVYIQILDEREDFITYQKFNF